MGSSIPGTTLGIAGPLDDVPLEDLQQRFVAVTKVQSRFVTAHAKLITHALGLLNHALEEHRQNRQPCSKSKG